MKDPSITEIMINDVRNIMIEKEGKLLPTGFHFKTAEELGQVTQSMINQTGHSLDPDHPYIDLILGDGSRVNIIAPPLTLRGPCITIRKFPTHRYTLHDLIEKKALDQKIASFLNFCTLGRLNLMISGGTGSGKTTLLNALAGLIPEQERIVTIEDTPEIVLQHPNSVQLQTKLQTPFSPPITTRDLVANALRMRPDRILVGECRQAEAFDMLQAMNIGHEGSMTTLHANSTRDALSRLETLCMFAGAELPVIAIRKQIASALDIIIQMKRLKNGKRQVVEITEVTGTEGDTITIQDIFISQNEEFKPTGFVPTFIERLKAQGLQLPPHFFQ
jgi:pilus assembly protein CpaF